MTVVKHAPLWAFASFHRQPFLPSFKSPLTFPILFLLLSATSNLAVLCNLYSVSGSPLSDLACSLGGN